MIGSEVLLLQLEEVEQEEYRLMEEWALKEQAMRAEGFNNQLLQERELFKHRLAAIVKWKAETEKLIGSPAEKDDEWIIQDLAVGAGDNALDKILEFYLEKVKERELQMQETL